jgi:hypothetical protein
MNRCIKLEVFFKNGISKTYYMQLQEKSIKLSDEELLQGCGKQYGKIFNTIFKEGINGHFDFLTENNTHIHIRMSEVVSISYKVVNY